eukprot:11202345-Lingulodinium_polyedra.AAC.1
MGYAWAMHGPCVGYAWAMHAHACLCMGYAWATHGERRTGGPLGVDADCPQRAPPGDFAHSLAPEPHLLGRP